MAKTVHALLVGIDAYPDRPLSGCANDVNAFHNFLEERVPADQRRIVKLLDHAATREGIIGGFRNHLRKAQQGDLALFYYSGHGAQEVAPEVFWKVEPDRLNETLVCYDSRPDGYDLADKELAVLIREVAATGAQVVVVLDSCHSGDATRKADVFEVKQVRTRRMSTHRRRRALGEYLDGVLGGFNAEQGASGWTVLPAGPHLLLAAARSDESALEKPLGPRGEQRGVFSFCLLKALAGAARLPTYRDLFFQVESLVRARSQQSPQLEAAGSGGGAIQAEPFLGGVAPEFPPYYNASRFKHPERGWVMDGGAIHGIQQPQGDSYTEVTLFDGMGTSYDPSEVRGLGKVVEVFATDSNIKIVKGNLDPERTYKAVVTGLPSSPLGVAVVPLGVGAADAADAVEQALAKASLLVLSSAEQARLIVEVRKGPQGEAQCLVRRAGEAVPLVAVLLVEEIRGDNAWRSDLVAEVCTHIARWQELIDLHNPQSGLSGAVEIDLRVPGPNGTFVQHEGSTVDLYYRRDGDAWVQPHIKLTLRNTSKYDLYCSVILLEESFVIDPDALHCYNMRIDKGGEFVVYGETIPAAIPKEYLKEGVTVYHDTLKLIVSTKPHTLNAVRQAGLRSLIDNRSRGKKSLGAPVDAEEQKDDWYARNLLFTIHRPLDSQPLSRTEPLALDHTLTVAPHPSLEAKLRLTTDSEASRDTHSTGGRRLPAWLRDHPENVRPVPLGASVGSRGEIMNVLELSDVNTHATVTHRDPLVLQLSQSLGDGVHVLATGFDAELECFLPLGVGRPAADGTEVRLDRLPAPEQTRSLGSALRIYLHKVISKPLGRPYDYPRLAAVTRDDGGTLRYEADPKAVTERVAMARRILVGIHGIIGETEPLLDALLPQTPPQTHEPYDLVLAFDYESINTPIDATARALKKRLETVGLGPDHGKTLHVVAHSMGGLVARTLIEREGGATMVQRLVLVGTPSAGSPWPTVQDWATAAIGFGLNTLGVVPWPLKVLGGLLSLLEKVDVALDQMKPGSDFLAALGDSEPPEVPYVLLVGDVQGTPALNERRQALARRLLQSAADLAFLRDPNDLAVSTASMRALPTAWAESLVYEVPCDHFSYFAPVEGQVPVHRALATPVAP